MKGTEKKRIIYFDIAKGIGIVLVLIGHLQTATIFSYSPYVLSLCSWIFSFHMALFFIISGMLICFKKENEKNLKESVKKKFSSIMIPYFWFSLIYIFIVLYSLLISKVVPLKTLFVQLWYVAGMFGMNVLWFLPALFAAEVLFLYITQRFKINKSVIVIIALCIVAAIVNYLRAYLPNNLVIYERLDELIITLIRPVFACAYILTGYGLFKGFELFEKKAKHPVVTEMILLPILLAINIYLNMLNRPVDFRSMVLNNYILYYICSVCGSLFIIILSRILSEIRSVPGKSPDNKDRDNKASKSCGSGDRRFRLLRFYGVNSLVFMAVHNNSSVRNLAERAAMYLNQYLTRARGYICYLTVILICLLYTTLTILLINRFFPFLAGKPVRRRNKASE